jgi:geranylgeranyl diphosphate synthase type II
MVTKNLKNYLTEKQDLTNQLLEEYLDKSNVYPKIIHKSMKYSVFNGGKRLRPILAFLANALFDGQEKHVYYPACGLELIHCYSLIHDDLPALDNDDYRRGKLTCHKKFGEDLAILAGDALLTKAFELFSEIDDATVLKKVLKDVTVSVGSKGMIGGQVADLESEGIDASNIKSKNLLKYIHKNKTAKLIETSLVVGALTAKATREQIKILRQYGECLGLMFQITDDILDIIGNKKLLGKKGSDLANKKLTYPSIYGLEASYKIVKKYKNKGIKLLNILVIENENKELLKALLEYVENRTF